MTVYSSPDQLTKIVEILSKFSRLPFFSGRIPGDVMEAVFASVRNGEVLHTYDFVDVINKKERCGWQIKSTKESTPVTWKRAKIPNASDLIEESQKSVRGLQLLGDAIINFCNFHVQESIELYDLKEIGYSRLIIGNRGSATYFEKLLCDRTRPEIFSPDDFYWKWSEPKVSTKKEQLQSLHGFHRNSHQKWWAWHGLGENQLHFSGENAWWPASDDPHQMKFQLSSLEMKLSLENFVNIISGLDS